VTEEGYARAGVAYYAVFDPMQKLGESVLRVYGLREGIYTELENSWMEQVGLGLTLWQGEFEGINYNWLRWCDSVSAAASRSRGKPDIDGK
jgi:hypothetical protein